MDHPEIVSPPLPKDLPQWWNQWVEFVRRNPGLVDHVGVESHYWGRHLFLGWETHKELFRAPRAVGVKAPNFADIMDYNDVHDRRAWRETKPSSLLLHEDILSEHCYIVGPSGAGKTSLGIMSLLIQLMRGGQTTSKSLPEPYPLVILDLKGDAALFNTVKREAEARGQKFKFFTTEKDAPTFRFNPFRGFDRKSRTVAQLCQLVLDALSLNHGKGYGRSYYTERSRSILSKTLKRDIPINSFDDLHNQLKEALRGTSDTKAKADAFELLSVIEMLTEYRQLVTSAEDNLSNTDSIIFMADVIKERQVAYFWLPAALESISVGEIAKLALFNLRVAAQDWKRNHPTDRRRILLVIDELQRVAGENLQGILQDARSFGISAILANQSLTDLKSATGFDLAPAIMTNTRVKFFFTSPSERECYVYVERGKGFTEPKPFPGKGNPWLKDLGPEDFAYHTRLAWPFPHEEYLDRDATPLPSWDAIPGGDYWRNPPVASTAQTPEVSDVLPHDFKLVRDEDWQKQVASIQALFGESDDDDGPPLLFPPLEVEEEE
jgi:hypothetical protein